MHSDDKSHPGHRRLKAVAATAAAVASLVALSAVPVQAQNGGTGATASNAPKGHAKLVHGKAIAPSDAPARSSG